MFRFTIRDVLLATLLVGLFLAWWLDRRYLSTSLAEASKWRMRAGALEEILRNDDWDVQWDFGREEVTAVLFKKKDGGRTLPGAHWSYSTAHFEPSANPNYLTRPTDQRR